MAAGVGKTVIAYCIGSSALAYFCSSLAINYLESRYLYDENIGLACVYFDHKQEFRTTDILASILKHIVQRRAVVSDELRELHRMHSKRETGPTLRDVVTALQVEISHFTKVFLVVDALDECPTREYTIDRILAELKLLLPGVRLMITGRPFAVSHISQLGGFETLEIRALDSDVEAYVRGQLNLDPSLRKLTSSGESELGELIVETVVAKAKGMY